MSAVKAKGTQLDTFGQRLRAERERLGLNQSSFGEACGVAKNAQINYESGKRSPDSEYLMASARLGVDINYVLTGQKSTVIPLPGGGVSIRDHAADIMREGLRALNHTAAEILDQAYADALDAEDRSAEPEAADTLHGTFVEVPVFSAELAAGDGAENGVDAIVDHLAFRRDWLKRMQVSPAAAVIARAWGDSMWPTLHPGDLLLIDRGHAEPPSKVRAPEDTRPASIYALLDDGRARVKRIERVSPGTLMLLSDNPASPPEVRPISTVSIIGRVVWWGHTNRE